jgi:hypothetical protein
MEHQIEGAELLSNENKDSEEGEIKDVHHDLVPLARD